MPFIALSVELEPIIYASKGELTQEELTSSVETIETEELLRSGGARLTDKLESTSSLTVNQTGVSGGQSSVFIRGLEARHTVFVIDGIRIYDAASIQRTLNPSMLNSANIERIEVLKGAQSVLYGSDAIGGVVNIITNKQNLENKISVSQGMYSSYEVSQNLLLENTLFNFSTFYQEDLKHNDLVIDSESDKKFNKGASLEISYAGAHWEFQTQLKLMNDFSENDEQDFSKDLPVDASDNHVDTTQFFGTQKIKYLKSKYSVFFLDLGVQNSNRVNKSVGSEYLYNGEVRQLELKWLGKNLLLGGVVVQEIYSDDEITEKKLENADVFAQLSRPIGDYIGEAGTRLSSSDYYGEHLVYNLGVSKKVSSMQTISLSQKSGFSAPSSYQLFGKTSYGSVGNEDLTPEKSISIELAHEYKAKYFRFGASVFQTKVEDHISFLDNQYENIDSSFYQGFEFDVSVSKSKYFGGVNGTLIDYHLSTGEEPERRPRESFKLTLGSRISDTSEVSLNYRYTGTRVEKSGGRSEILSAYDVIDINYSKTIGNFRLNADVKNIFDKVYEEAHLYATNRLGLQFEVTYSY